MPIAHTTLPRFVPLDAEWKLGVAATGLDLAADLDRDGIGRVKAAYLADGPERSNLAYGYVVPRG